jgi:hypothetical protein
VPVYVPNFARQILLLAIVCAMAVTVSASALAATASALALSVSSILPNAALKSSILIKSDFSHLGRP